MRRGRSVPLRGRDRLWLVGGLFAVVLILGGGIVTMLQPQHVKTVAARATVTNAETDQVAELARLRKLRDDNEHLADYRSQLAANQAALPTDDAVPDLLRELQAAGSAAGVAVGTVTVGPPTAVKATPAAAPAAPTAATPTAAPTAGTTAAADGAATVYAIVLSVAVTGSPAGQTEFLRQLQAVQPRAMLVTAVNQAAAAAGSTATGDTTTLSLTAFVAPASAPTPAR